MVGQRLVIPRLPSCLSTTHNGIHYHFMGQPDWGTLGCWTSHFLLFKKQVDEAIPMVVRFEDDHIPSDKINQAGTGQICLALGPSTNARTSQASTRRWGPIWHRSGSPQMPPSSSLCVRVGATEQAA
jgi:hypothetical protein